MMVLHREAAELARAAAVRNRALGKENEASKLDSDALTHEKLADEMAFKLGLIEALPLAQSQSQVQARGGDVGGMQVTGEVRGWSWVPQQKPKGM